MDTITDLLGGDHGTAELVIAQLDTNPLTLFTDLLLKEEKKQANDNVVDDNQCRK